MPNKKRASFSETEQAILDAAGDLFDRNGFNRTSLQDIADAVGMSRPALYHYFDSRTDILVVGIGRVCDERNAMTERLRDVGGLPTERLRLLMLGLAELVSENAVWIRIELRELAALPDDARGRERASRLGYYELLLATVTEAIEAGHVRPFDDRAIALTIISTLAGLRGTYTANVEVAPEEAADLAVDVILNGIMRSKELPGTPTQRGIRMIRDGLGVIERLSRHGAT